MTLQRPRQIDATAKTATLQREPSFNNDVASVYNLKHLLSRISRCNLSIWSKTKRRIRGFSINWKILHYNFQSPCSKRRQLLKQIIAVTTLQVHFENCREGVVYLWFDGLCVYNWVASILTLKCSPTLMCPMKIKRPDITGISISSNLTIRVNISARNVGH